MPKVRILSGSQAGAVVDYAPEVAQSMVDTGFAEHVLGPAVTAEVAEERPVRKPTKKKDDDE